MIGVTSGVAATLGILKPTPELFTQMATCMGLGEWVSGCSPQPCDLSPSVPRTLAASLVSVCWLWPHLSWVHQLLLWDTFHAYISLGTSWISLHAFLWELHFFVCIMGRLLWHQCASPYSEYFLSFRLYHSAGSVSGTSSAQVNMASKYLTSFHCLNLTQTTPCCSCFSVPNSRHV